MQFKPRNIVGISLVLTTLLATTCCGYNESAVARVTGRRTLKENDVDTLVSLIYNDGDLIKIAAHRTLVKLYLDANLDDEKKLLVVALMKSSVEVIRYYGIVKSRNLKSTYDKGIAYAKDCETLNNDSSLCNKWKAQLMQTYYTFLKVGNSTKKQLKEAIRIAKEAEENREMMDFIEAKVACEENLVTRIKNTVNKNAANKMNCVDKLLPFVKNFSKLGSFEGEYHYLLGKSYEKQNNAIMALKHYHEVRYGIVYDTKTRYFNQKAQVEFDKLYLRENLQ